MKVPPSFVKTARFISRKEIAWNALLTRDGAVTDVIMSGDQGGPALDSG